MRTLYKHVHLVIDDKREYLDGSILINDQYIEDVFVQSNRNIDEDCKVVDMKNKIFIPSFFDSKSKSTKQKGVLKKYICSDKVLEQETHLLIDKDIKETNNICAITFTNNYKKINSIKTLCSPNNSIIDNVDGISDITALKSLSFDNTNMLNYALSNKCFCEFGIDDSISNEYIKFILKNIDVSNLTLVSYNHDDFDKQIKRLHNLNIPLVDIVALSSYNALKFYGQDKLEGSLIKGKLANIVCLDEDMNIEFVLCKGEKDA